jgi:PII-like signaling protein
MDTDLTVVRIYLTEAEQGRHRNLIHEVLALLHDKHGLKQVTVFRGIAGTGERGGESRAADVLRVLVDLPLIVEFFDKPAVVEAVLPILKQMIPNGRFLSWSASIR